MMLPSKAPSRPTRGLTPSELAVLREGLRPLIATNKLQQVENNFVRGILVATLLSSVLWMLIIFVLYDAIWKS
jgi:hypothetical protein